MERNGQELENESKFGWFLWSLKKFPALLILTPLILLIAINLVTITFSVIGFFLGLSFTIYKTTTYRRDITKYQSENIIQENEQENEVENNYFSDNNEVKSNELSDKDSSDEDSSDEEYDYSGDDADENKFDEEQNNITWFIDLVKKQEPHFQGNNNDKQRFETVLKLLHRYNQMLRYPNDFLIPAIKAWCRNYKDYKKNKTGEKMTYQFKAKDLQDRNEDKLYSFENDNALLKGNINNTIILWNMLGYIIPAKAFKGNKLNDQLKGYFDQFKAALADNLTPHKDELLKLEKDKDTAIIISFIKQCDIANVKQGTCNYRLIFSNAVNALEENLNNFFAEPVSWT